MGYRVRQVPFRTVFHCISHMYSKKIRSAVCMVCVLYWPHMWPPAKDKIQFSISSEMLSYPLRFYFPFWSSVLLTPVIKFIWLWYHDTFTSLSVKDRLNFLISTEMSLVFMIQISIHVFLDGKLLFLFISNFVGDQILLSHF